MLIPKIIHYCWFGKSEKPKLAKKCIESWKKNCPDYQIIEWNEDNYDITSAPLFVQQAIEAKKWAFATDYIRLKVVYDYGGIYLDTDVEVIKNLDPFLDKKALKQIKVGGIDYIVIGQDAPDSLFVIRADIVNGRPCHVFMIDSELECQENLEVNTRPESAYRSIRQFVCLMSLYYGEQTCNEYLGTTE